MGIRFNCPNGHRLNVKSFLAGKRGICPHCQAKFVIPQESTSASSVPDPSSDELTPPATADSPAGQLSTESPSQVDISTMPVAEVQTRPSESKAIPAHDPIAEAPHAVWYVRPPTGGQFGPATGDVMRTWIGEGRVPTDALVWREGWAEWQKANLLFPALAHAAPVAPQPESTTSGDFPAIVTDSKSDPVSSSRTQRGSRRSNSLIVGFLVIACVALFFVLLLVLRGS